MQSLDPCTYLEKELPDAFDWKNRDVVSQLTFVQGLVFVFVNKNVCETNGYSCVIHQTTTSFNQPVTKDCY